MCCCRVRCRCPVAPVRVRSAKPRLRASRNPVTSVAKLPEASARETSASRSPCHELERQHLRVPPARHGRACSSSTRTAPLPERSARATTASSSPLGPRRQGGQHLTVDKKPISSPKFSPQGKVLMVSAAGLRPSTTRIAPPPESSGAEVHPVSADGRGLGSAGQTLHLRRLLQTIAS